FTVQEIGKTGQKCKVLKTWKTPEGKIAYQVQALDTGEVMTVVESGGVKNMSGVPSSNGSHTQAVATRIFHWGSDRKPPPGTPMPPIDVVQNMLSAFPKPEAKKMPSAEPVEVTKPTVLPRPEIPPPPVVVHAEPAKTGLFHWFSRSTEPPVTSLPP